MGFSLIPKDDVFFEMFSQQMDIAYMASKVLSDLFKNYSDPETKIGAIKAYENKGDELGHEVIDRLNKTFITPIDREDVLYISTKADDIMDYIDETAASLVLYNVENIRSEAINITEVLVSCCEKCRDLLKLMVNIRDIEPMRSLWIEVNRLENVADGIHKAAVSRLFKEESDPIEVIKWDKIYNQLESCIDLCEELAAGVETVATKHA